jgi:microcystin-dependent protein
MPSAFDSSSRQAVPIGTVLPIPSSGVPPGYLKCDGSSLSRSVYSELWSVLNTVHGTVDGLSFNIPDYRGRFLRGADESTGRDPDAGSRVAMNSGGAVGNNIGTLQTDAMQGHYHNFNNGITGSGGLISGAAGDVTGINTIVRQAVTDGLHGTPRLSNETRPANAYTVFMIRYK